MCLTACQVANKLVHWLIGRKSICCAITAKEDYYCKTVAKQLEKHEYHV